METQLEEFTELTETEADRGNPLTAELEQADPNLYREASARMLDFIFDALRVVKSYKGNESFASDCLCAALGGRGWAIIGVRDQDELARKWGCTKQNVSKLIKKMQSPAMLNLPPMPGQRSLNGCANMSRQRKAQLQ